MKKVLIAGAALIAAGALVVPAAVAEITLSGDARVRYAGQSGYGIGTAADDYRDNFTSRVRLNIEGVAKGGAFANARLRLANGVWDGDGSLRESLRTDYAYVGIPMGAVTVYAGMVEADLADFSDFFYNGGGETRVQVAYEGEGFNLAGFYQIDDEGAADKKDMMGSDDNANDDASSIGMIASFAPADNMNISTILWYMMDDKGGRYWDHDGDGYETVARADKTGLQASLRFEGEMDALGLEAELSYRAADLQSHAGSADTLLLVDGVTSDAGIGGYAGVSYNMGAFTPGAILGFTSDGFTPHGDFGFLMFGGDTPITVIPVGNADSSYWAALTGGYAVSEQLTLNANLVYVDFSDYEFKRGVDADGFEISGALVYTVSEDATIGYGLGYLAADVDHPGATPDQDIDAVGHFVELKIKF